jgi:very-short-patch-repair endonuclease
MEYENRNRTNAKNLRKNMTKEERHLWYDFLSPYPLHFYRQRRIGAYIVDFYCPKAKLVVELDGSQHFENDSIQYDAKRTEYLESLGLRVLRVPNNEISDNFANICDYIDYLVKKQTSSDKC